MRIYEKPCMTVTCYNAEDNTNYLTLNATSAIAPYNNAKAGTSIGSQSFTLHS